MLADLRAALAFLTILPVGYPQGRQPGYAFAYFPLVGLLLGAILGGVAALPYPTPELRAFVVLVVWVVLTGGLHLDGLADSCDGLLATTTPERRLEIMRDPRTGAWGVIGLVLLLLGKWTLLQAAPAAALLLPPIIGRWWLVYAAYAYPYARSQGLGGYFRAGLGRRQIVLATLTVCAVIAVMAAGSDLPVLLAVSGAGLGGAAVAQWTASRLGGGLTGDVYGAICEGTEWVCLLLLVIGG